MPSLHPVAPPAGAEELLTPTWRFWLWPGGPPAAVDRIYVTAAPEHLGRVCELTVQALQTAGAPAPATIRLVRNESALADLQRMPDWAGKAITLYLPAGGGPTIAYHLDSLLANQGLHGPPVLRARPFGGRSGMVFHRAAAAGTQSNLARLLGGSDA